MGASFDGPEELAEFRQSQGLGFRLLAAPKYPLGAAFDVLRDQEGRGRNRPARITYVIDPEGVVAAAVDVGDDTPDIRRHAGELVELLRELVGGD